MTSIFTSAATTGLGLYTALRGAPQLVRFESDNGTTIVQFDAVMNETYTHAAQPTAFPVEDGSTISDHLVRAPQQIDLVGMVTDTKIAGLTQILQSAATVAATAVLPPLGVLGASAAISTWLTDDTAQSPSKSAYAKLVRLCDGDDTGQDTQSASTFSVVTRLGRVKNCGIVNLSVPRDVEISGALIFNITLVRLVVVQPQVVNVSLLDKPALASMKQSLSQQQADLQSKFEKGDIAGVKYEKDKLGKIGIAVPD